MYLDHFGFAEQPFPLSSVHDFFFEGAGRGEILDSLIYVLTHGEGEEGVIKVTGSPGSGKTWICRLIMSRLPRHMHTVYFGNLNISKEAFGRSLVTTLNLELADDPGTAESSACSMQRLSEALIKKYAPSRQIVLLIDEAHNAPPELMEELRLLYELASPHDKLLQIVLFGEEATLDKLLASPPLQMLKNSITHHFFLQPIAPGSLKDYLLQRLHAAGYHGPDIFTQPALRLIAGASSGLIDHINTLSHKSLSAAFRENTKKVEPQHVRSAIQDSGFGQHAGRSISASYIIGGSVAAAAAVVVAVIFATGELARQPSGSASKNIISGNAVAPSSIPSSDLPVAATPTYNTAPATTSAMATSPALPPAAPQSNLPPKNEVPVTPSVPAVPDMPSGNNLATTTEQKRSSKSAVAGVKLADYPLLRERVDATVKMLGSTDKQNLTLQLFSTDNVQPERMERFLGRAQSLVSLSDLYVYPVNTGGQAKFRVAYGIYLTRRQADAAVSELPQKYQDAFHPEVNTLGELQ